MENEYEEILAWLAMSAVAGIGFWIMIYDWVQRLKERKRGHK